MNRSSSPFLSSNLSPLTYILQSPLCPSVRLTDLVPPVSFHFLSRRHQSDGNEISHTRLRASTRDLRASPKPTSKSTIEEDLKKLIDLESPPPESQKNFKVRTELGVNSMRVQMGWSCSQLHPPRSVGSWLFLMGTHFPPSSSLPSN